MHERPLRVAVVGSGPAAFYAAGHLLASESPQAEVDLIERLPTPWGLVRLGVAPDHPNLKTVSRAFEKIAQRPGFRFLGNVEAGKTSRTTSSRACTTPSSTRSARRRIAGSGSRERIFGLVGATELVAWYNSHPDWPRVRPPSSERSSSATGTSRSTSRGCWRSLPRTRPHRHDRPRDRGDLVLRAARDRRPRSARARRRRGRRPSSRRWASSRRGRDRRRGRARARPGERGEARRRLEHRAAQRRDPAGLRRTVARREGSRGSPALPGLTGRDPR